MEQMKITGNDKMLFDVLNAYLDKKIDENHPDFHKGKIALQAFLDAPRQEHKKSIIQARNVSGMIHTARVQGAAVSTDFDLLTTSAFNAVLQAYYYDLYWQEAFMEVPRDADRDYWEVATITNLIGFIRIAEGGRITADMLKGVKENIYVSYYGGALGFTDNAIRFRKLAQMYEAAVAFRNSFFLNQANNHYFLIAVAAGANPLGVITWQGTTGDTQLQRDILTLNKAQKDLAVANKDKGYGNTVTMPFIIYAHINDEPRLTAALLKNNVTQFVDAQKGERVTNLRQFQVYYSLNANITEGYPIMVLPGHKIQRNEALAPTSYVAPEDILTLNRVQSVWSIYGAGIADADQVLQFTLG